MRQKSTADAADVGAMHMGCRRRQTAVMVMLEWHAGAWHSLAQQEGSTCACGMPLTLFHPVLLAAPDEALLAASAAAGGLSDKDGHWRSASGEMSNAEGVAKHSKTSPQRHQDAPHLFSPSNCSMGWNLQHC